MTWAPVTMRWPEQATAWIADLDDAKLLANGEMASSAERLKSLDGLVKTNPGPVGEAAKAAVTAGREAMTRQLGEAPSCVVLTPFQSGVGQGTGYQRFLSAPNLLEKMALKLDDLTDSGRPAGEQYALSILFLSTRLDQFASALARFNALLPMQELERAERRARYLYKLETEKTEMPIGNATPRWQPLPLESCTLLKAAKQSMSGQLAMLESYADSSPLDELAKLSEQKAAQQLERDQELANLKAMLATNTPDLNMRARLIGPGNDLRRELLAGEQPGHEWVLCAGLLLVGTKEGLSFVQELVGL
ncbi:hypothetical protein [Pseudomonas sp. MRSN 12121]|uniref:hypothetical protein n=1 Tax=Pseudomonas sp. MRSN 12121 TaxID=1611770 RepID=UPI0005BEA3B9|nr:hypothetical protein [Pseudomonas sp. MRSN 12121]AJO81046.1 prophage PSSB64-01 [Pseudomonas sp. MRSN 12121]